MKIFSHAKIVRHLSYMLGSEGAVRIVRVIATIAMARYLDVAEFGLLAIALTVHELIAILAANGLNLYVLKGRTEPFSAATNTVYTIMWFWCSGLMGIQLSLAWVASFCGFGQVALLITALAPLHLMMPLAYTHLYLIQKRNQLGTVAGWAAAQNAAESIATLGLLIADFGIWAVIAGKGIATLVWVSGIRRSHEWYFSRQYGFVSFLQPLKYAKPVLLSESGRSVRTWGDHFLVGGLLGADVLGIYYFAKNSGLGISLGLSQAGVNALLPRLAELRQKSNQETAQVRNVVFVSSVLALIILVQAVFAPLYVPLIFGEKWLTAVPVVALLCLSAIPRCVSDMHCCLARVNDMENFEARWSSVYTGVYLLGIALGGLFGLIELALACIGVNLAMCIWVVRAIKSSEQFKNKYLAGGLA